MFWNDQKLSANVRQAETADLLDRITAYRKGMEPHAIDLIERELHQRGVTQAQIAARREECERTCLYWSDGTAVMCSFCRKPAVVKRWGWHKLGRTIPFWPRRVHGCADHSR